LREENSMNKSDHLETLKTHYLEEIHEALRESEHEKGTIIDYVKLNDLILYSWKSAHIQGVDLETFVNWIGDAIPQHIDNIDIVKINKAA